MTAFSESATIMRIWPCWSGGKALMMRSTVEEAVVVWSVASTRWPGLGGRDRERDRLEVAHLADEDHVRVLAQRLAQRLGEGAVCDGTSRWLTSDSLFGWTYSIGSSTVMMWPRCVSLMRSTSAASVVVLPQPAGAGHEDEALRVGRDLPEALGQADVRRGSGSRRERGGRRRRAPCAGRRRWCGSGRAPGPCGRSRAGARSARSCRRVRPRGSA